MTQFLRFSSCLFLIVSFSFYVGANDSIYSETWYFDNLTKIGGHQITLTGSPVVVQTDIGPAIKFNGVRDRILVDSNPIADAEAFTVEMVFNADPAYATNYDPRFLHIQDPNDPLQKRVMMELRITAENLIYLDGYMKTDIANLALIDEKLTHPSGVWHHAALVYQNDTLTTYFNGKKELSGFVPFSKAFINPTGKTSVGARMNERNYYKGMIRAIKVTRAAISPDDFFYLAELTSSVKNLRENTQQKVQVLKQDGNLMVNLSMPVDTASNWQIDIYDTLGRRVHHSQHRNTMSVSLPFSQLGNPQSLLTVKVSTPDGVYTHKINP